MVNLYDTCDENLKGGWNLADQVLVPHTTSIDVLS